MSKCLSRAVLAGVLSLLLSACVTLPGAPNASASDSPGDSVQTAINSGVSALSDFFSPEMRELKKLVTEGKMDEAKAFLADKSAFFEERYKAGRQSVPPPELVSLAEHALAHDWRPKLLTASVGLNTSLAFDDAAAREKAGAALKASEEAQAAVEGAVLFKVVPRVGREEVASLVKARESLLARAEAAKPDVAAGMLEEVLTSAKSSYPFVGALSLFYADFSGSAGFQAAALAKLQAAATRAELEPLANRLRPYLSEASGAKVDERFVELVRKELLADGRISLSELGQLEQMRTPIGSSTAPFKGLVKVGLAETVRKNGTREFSVNAAKDLAFDLDDAADALLTRRDGSAYDFMYVVSIQDARVERETGSPSQETSRYRAGTDREPNPAYEQARQRLSSAESTRNRVRAQVSEAKLDASRCPPSRALACALAFSAIEYGVASAEQEVKEARTALSNTPSTLEKPRFSSYQYRLVPHTVKKAVSGVAVLWDVKGKQAWVFPAERNEQRTFHLVQGVHGTDENRDSILGRADKPQDVDRFAREVVELSLDSLFAPGRLSSARKESAMNAVAVLQLMNQEYDRNAPQDDPPSVGRVFRLK